VQKTRITSCASVL